jgi:hypothetical protein
MSTFGAIRLTTQLKRTVKLCSNHQAILNAPRRQTGAVADHLQHFGSRRMTVGMVLP